MCPSPGRWHGLINTNQDFPLEAAEPVAYLLSEQFNISCAITKTIVFDRHSPVFKWTILSNPIQQVNSFSYWNVYFTANLPGWVRGDTILLKKKKKNRHSPKARLNCFYGQGSQLVVFKSAWPGGNSLPPRLAEGILIPPPSLLLAQGYRSLEILNKTASCLDRKRDKRNIPEKREWPEVGGNWVELLEEAEGIKPKEEIHPQDKFR